jgi:hypothetical protein
MPTHHTKSKLRNSRTLQQLCLIIGLVIWLPRSRWAKRLVYGFAGLLTAFILGMYGIAQWYIHSEANKPLQLGVSFIPDYAESLGLDPQQTMNALIDAGVKQFRLVSYWSDSEPSKGTYDFSQLDWQFKTAEAHHAKIILTLGLRQPRWPECHMPSWASNETPAVWQPQLGAYMQSVIKRYQHSSSLQSYQLENEYFLKGFGNCDSIPGAEDRNRLISEYQLLKQLDSKHPVIIGRSNNSLGWPVGKPQPDLFSVSIYKRVWDAGASRRYLEYPQPGWFYGFLAGWQKIVNHRDMIIGELQGEAWPPRGQDIQKISLAEQNKSMNAVRLKDRIDYGKATGMKQIELWGAEYWYYRDIKLHDPSLMNVARQEFNK